MKRLLRPRAISGQAQRVGAGRSPLRGPASTARWATRRTAAVQAPMRRAKGGVHCFLNAGTNTSSKAANARALRMIDPTDRTDARLPPLWRDSKSAWPTVARGDDGSDDGDQAFGAIPHRAVPVEVIGPKDGVIDPVRRVARGGERTANTVH